MKRKFIVSALALLAFVLPGVSQQTAPPAIPSLPASPALPKPLEHTYRLTYTLTVTEAGKQVGVQHFTMTVSAPTNRGTVKMGEKVPVVTGNYGPDGKAGVETQFTYLDVGINIDASVSEDASGVELTSKVEQSSVAPAPAKIAEVNEPIIRQMVLSNTSLLVPGKRATLGSLDIPDTTRHVDIDVTAEVVP